METVLSAISISAATTAATSVINSITTLSTNIYTLVSHIKLSKNIHQTEIINILNKTDIEATIKLLHAFILEIPTCCNNSHFIVIALTNVNNIIQSIEDELVDIKNKISYNNSLQIMTSVRSFDCTPNLENIQLKINILDRRCDYLFKTLSVFKIFIDLK
jgi:hypothetical protein